MQLEKTFITSNTINKMYDNNKTYYYTFSHSSSSGSLAIYNSDYSLYKEIAYKQYPGYKVASVFYPSFHLFNTDNSLEYICSYYNSTSTEYLTKLFDENGNELMDFGDAEAVDIFKTSDTTYILETYHFVTTYTYKDSIIDGDDTVLQAIPYYSFVTKMYKMTGVSHKTNLKSAEKNIINLFPNPSGSFINLIIEGDNDQPLRISIYNINGNLIDQKIIDKNVNHVFWDVSSYKPGVYLYKYGKATGKFVVN